MLGYEWGNHSPPPPNLILTDVDLHHDPSSSSSSSSHHHHRPIFDDPFSAPCTFPHDTTIPITHHVDNYPQNQIPLFSDPRAFPSAYQPYPSSLIVPKPEPDFTHHHPIGLNLGRRTYFSADDDLLSRLYRRSRPADAAVHSPKCQAEGCNADLTNAKHYHRRHKVCEFHSKASTVIAAGLTQRFCQQCSRFHILSEFDNGKRSCRKRLADHNRRRRKSHQSQSQDHHRSTASMSENAATSPSQNILRSPSDSGINSSPSVTVAVSPPRVSFDTNFMQTSYE